MHDESRILDMTPLRPQYRLNLILSQSRLNPCYFFHFFFCINEFIIEQEGRLPFANDFHGTGVVVLLGHLHYSWDLSWIELPLSHPAGPSGHLSRLSFFFFLLKLACVRIYSLLPLGLQVDADNVHMFLVFFLFCCHFFCFCWPSVNCWYHLNFSLKK
jgi:hypothetical protein